MEQFFVIFRNKRLLILRWWITFFIIRDLTFFPIDQVRQIRIKLIPELIYLIFYSPKNSIFQKIKKLRLIPGLMIMTQRCVKNSSFSIVFHPGIGLHVISFYPFRHDMDIVTDCVLDVGFIPSYER